MITASKINDCLLRSPRPRPDFAGDVWPSGSTGGGGARSFSVGTASGGRYRERMYSVGGSGGLGVSGGRPGRWIRRVGGS